VGKILGPSTLYDPKSPRLVFLDFHLPSSIIPRLYKSVGNVYFVLCWVEGLTVIILRCVLAKLENSSDTKSENMSLTFCCIELSTSNYHQSIPLLMIITVHNQTLKQTASCCRQGERDGEGLTWRPWPWHFP